ncbi:MAG: hypothetical protein J6Y99_06455 [Bacteroidales bacterium]|nr:hypothetical protein [Bacteroidales bacterium]
MSYVDALMAIRKLLVIFAVQNRSIIMKKRLFYFLLGTLLIIGSSCGLKRESDNASLAHCGVFDHNAEKIVLTKEVWGKGRPVFPGGYDSLRCYLARNIRYDKVLDVEEWPQPIFVSYIVNADCSISIPEDFAFLPRFRAQSAESKYKEQEARRVISSLKYEKPPMKYDTLTGQWVPTSMRVSTKVCFRRNQEAELYDKDTVLARMDREYSNCEDVLVNRRFKQYTTDEEKIELCQGNHSWATKVNALVGLVESGNPAYKRFLPVQLVDTTTVTILFDDTGYLANPADVVIGQIRENMNRISVRDKACVDSIVLYSEAPMGILKLELSERSKILSEMEPRPEYYERVREVWMKDTIPGALALLAKYRREEDFKFIMHTLEQYDAKNIYSRLFALEALKAVANWPDTRFVPAIERIVEEESACEFGRGGDCLATALLAYRNDWALGQLRKIMHQGNCALIWECNDVLVQYVESHPDDDFSSMFRIVEKKTVDWE